MDFIKLPPVDFVAISYVSALVVMLFCALIMRNRIRINSTLSWVMYVFVAPLPVAVCYTAASAVLLPTDAAIYSVVMAMLLGLLHFHWLMPALLPDFQTENISTSCVTGFLLGVVVLIVGLTLPSSFPRGLVGTQNDLFGTTSDSWEEGAF